MLLPHPSSQLHVLFGCNLRPTLTTNLIQEHHIKPSLLNDSNIGFTELKKKGKQNPLCTIFARIIIFFDVSINKIKYDTLLLRLPRPTLILNLGKTKVQVKLHMASKTAKESMRTVRKTNLNEVPWMKITKSGSGSDIGIKKQVWEIILKTVI